MGIAQSSTNLHKNRRLKNRFKAQDLQFIISVAALGAPQALQCLRPCDPAELLVFFWKKVGQMPNINLGNP